MGWHFIPWTLQYLAAAVIIISLTVFVFSRSPRNRASQFFLLFGVFIVLWQIMMFLHRNAPDIQSSKYFFCFGMFSSLIAICFLSITIINIPQDRDKFTFILLPAIIIASIILYTQPFKMVWAEDLGWSMKPANTFLVNMMLATIFFYTILIIFVSAILIKRYPTIRRKISIIIVAWIGINTLGVIFTNLFLIAKNPNTPPFGGIFNIITFIIIAYAIGLPTSKLTLKRSTEISLAYYHFLKELFDNTPGNELGIKLKVFQEYLEAMGLDDLVILDTKGNFKVNSDILDPNSIDDFVETTLRGLKVIPVRSILLNHFSDVINIAYDTIKYSKSRDVEAWSKNLLKEHGVYLFKHGALNKIRFVEVIPKILDNFNGSNKVLIKMIFPHNVYDGLSKINALGFKIFCITKYPPSLLLTKFEILENVLNIIDLLKKDNDFKKIDNLTGMLIEEIEMFARKNNNPFIVIDCLDQIITSAGKNDTINFMKYLLKENNNIYILYVINPKIVFKDVFDIEKMKEGSGLYVSE